MKIAIIGGMVLLAIPSAGFAQDSAPKIDRAKLAQERPFVNGKPEVNPRRITQARKKQARIKAARLKQKRIKSHRIKQARLKHKRIKMARRKAAAGR